VSRRPRHRQAGFTIVELLVALVIAVLIMGAGYELSGEVAVLTRLVPESMRTSTASIAFPVLVRRQFEEAGRAVAAAGPSWWIFVGVQRRLQHRDFAGRGWRFDEAEPARVAARYRLLDGVWLYEEYEDTSWQGKTPVASLRLMPAPPGGDQMLWLVGDQWRTVDATESFGPVASACWATRQRALLSCW
jgi:prepilin-type N-terminal cleavage/methylation domain-containing protein